MRCRNACALVLALDGMANPTSRSRNIIVAKTFVVVQQVVDVQLGILAFRVPIVSVVVHNSREERRGISFTSAMVTRLVVVYTCLERKSIVNVHIGRNRTPQSVLSILVTVHTHQPIRVVLVAIHKRPVLSRAFQVGPSRRFDVATVRFVLLKDGLLVAAPCAISRNKVVAVIVHVHIAWR